MEDKNTNKDAEEKIEKNEKQDKIMYIMLYVLGVVMLLILILFASINNKDKPLKSTNSDDRFEIVYEQNIPSDKYIVKILVDRDTDIEYLLLENKISHSTSIELMRDKGGMVLLRE